MVCKASKNVYFSDSHLLIMTSYTRKWRHTLKYSAILDFKIFQKCQNISKFDFKKWTKYKDAKTVKILEETLVESENLMKN